MKGQKKIFLEIVLALALVFWGVTSAFPAKWFGETIVQAVKENIIKKQVVILPQLNGLDIGFGKYEGIEYYFIKNICPIFFQNKEVQAEVQSIAFDHNAITMELYNDILGRGKVTYRFKEQIIQDVTTEKLETILLTALADKSHSNVYCDPKSKIFHVYSCNHLPDGAVPMTIENAERDGYRKCGVCFRETLYLPAADLEFGIRDEMMRRLHYLVLDDLPKQENFQSLVNKILANWPFRLIGYDYKVKVINANPPKSVAVGGILHISSSYLDSVNNMEELEAVLVREIAHSERRHALRKARGISQNYQDAQALAIMGAAMGGMGIAAAGGSNSHSASAFGVVSGALLGASVYNLINLVGYGEEYETEADSLASLYFRINQKDINNLLNVIRKSEFDKLVKFKKTNLYERSSSDPYRQERIERIVDNKIQYFGEQERYVTERKDNCPVQLNLNYQEISAKDNRLMAYINNNNTEFLQEYISNIDKEISLLITDNHGERDFRPLASTMVSDFGGYYLTFEQSSSRKKTELLTEIRKISLVIRDTATNPMRMSTPNVVFTFTKLN